MTRWAFVVVAVGPLLVAAACGEPPWQRPAPGAGTAAPLAASGVAASPVAPDDEVERPGVAEDVPAVPEMTGEKGAGEAATVSPRWTRSEQRSRDPGEGIAGVPFGTPLSAAGGAASTAAGLPSAGRPAFAQGRMAAEPTGEASPRPEFSDVARRTPAEVVAYLGGRLPEYPGGGPEALVDFSTSDILESTDAAVVDWVGRHHGAEGLRRVYEGIARAVLETLREQYGQRWVLVPLDAGHGGKRDVSWEGGAGGTEADYTRGVAAAMLRLGQDRAYRRIILRPVYNDAMSDDLGLPKPLDKPSLNRVVVRQARASMLAAEAAAWNWTRPESERVAVHEIAIHFNAGAGGAMVLHQGDTVRPERVAQSVQFARRYLRLVMDELNGTGLLPEPLRLWGGDGLHDDVMMYRPAYLSDQEIGGMTLRYGALQGKGYLTRYVETVVAAQAGGQ